jgi:hypothetical protein
MQEICLDRKEFKVIRKIGGVYVDKTKHIYDIFGRGLYYFLARPRRFGKSLLCTTLIELFEGNRELFKGLWIETSDWKWETHPVIHLDMSLIASATATAANVRQGMINLLLENAESLGITDLVLDTPYLMFEQLIKKAKALTHSNVVIIIDEYDKPLLDVIDESTQYKEIHKELSAFYSQLKPAEKKLKFVLITGVFKFTQTSIFSGLNNLNDITFDPAAGELLGYTEEEIKTFFAEHLEALAKTYEKTADEMMLALREKYNGYRFGVNIATTKLSNGVYNPYALNYVFEKQQQIDKWFASGSPTALIKKLADDNFSGLNPKNLMVEFKTLDDSCSPSDITSLSLLYYAGYMTIQRYGDGDVTLDFPNLHVAQAFAKKLLPVLLQKSIELVNQLVRELNSIFKQQRLDDFKNILNDILASVAYQVLTRPHDPVPLENLYQIAFHCTFLACNVRTVIEDMTNRGRIDISVELPDIVYLFELKMDEAATNAIAQIKERDYARKFKHTGKKVYAIGVSVSSKKRFVQELVWELL